MHLRRPNIGKRSHGMPIQATQRHLVKVDQPDVCGTGTCKSSGAMRPNSSAADDDDFCISELGEPGVAEKYAVACELFEDELCRAASVGMVWDEWEVAGYLRRSRLLGRELRGLRNVHLLWRDARWLEKRDRIRSAARP